MDPHAAHAFEKGFAKGFPILPLAEDDVLLRNFLLHVLQILSFAVLVAADGQEAIELSRSFGDEIALLLTGMVMPRTGGSELTELILRERPGIRVLQMSGALAESFVGRDLTMAFLQEPFTPTVLFEKIREVMTAPPNTPRLISSLMQTTDYRRFDADSAKGLSVILLAESNVVVRNFLSRTLRRMSRVRRTAPFAVLVAADGQEAIEVSRSYEEQIALLLTDMEMPRMHGSELTELILRERPGIRVLQISREPEESFVGRNLTAAFLQKPFSSGKLVRKIRKVLAAPVGAQWPID